jgi:sigma-B regulation protein RsbU (phosphoserine phosphatase)
MGDGSWIVYVADVSDKGLPAALVMVALWSKIRSEVPLHNDIERLLEAVNNSMYDLFSQEGYFATIILGRYWPATGRLSLIRGGHLPPLRIKGGSYKSVPKLEGASLGIARQLQFTKGEVNLSPGESIIFVSDGVTEAQNTRNELFGMQRLASTIQKKSYPPWGSDILTAIRNWQGAAAQSDDLTILEIWRDFP